MPLHHGFVNKFWTGRIFERLRKVCGGSNLSTDLLLWGIYIKKCISPVRICLQIRNARNASIKFRKTSESKKAEKSLEISAFLVFSCLHLNQTLIMAGIAGLRTVVFAYIQRMRSFTYAKTLSDARHRSGSSSLSQTIKRENADAFSLFMAGIAGLEPAMQESKSCALTDLAISHRYGVLYHIRRRCVKMTCGVLLSFFGKFLRGVGNFL